MRSYSTGTRNSRHSKEVTHYVEIWEQPWHWWVISNLYHLYESHSSWFMKHIESWHTDISYWCMENVKKLSKEDLDEWKLWTFTPLRVRQDLRCYDLAHKKRISHADFEITREQHVAMVKTSAADSWALAVTEPNPDTGDTLHERP